MRARTHTHAHTKRERDREREKERDNVHMYMYEGCADRSVATHYRPIVVKKCMSDKCDQGL